MDYLNKKDQKFIGKVLNHYMKRKTPLIKNPVYYNADKLPVYCYKIKTIDDYINYVEPITREVEEWYVILKINNIHPSRTLPNREYVYCNAKNVIVKISNEIIPNFHSFTNIFILPKGTVSFFNIMEKEKLWIK